MSPLARTENLLQQPVGEELILLDRISQRAYHLNPAAATVWKYCDGRHSVEELAALLQQRFGWAEPSRDAALLALEELQQQDLLITSGETEETPQELPSRRDLAKKMAVAASALPVAAAIAVPPPARAASATSQGPITFSSVKSSAPVNSNSFANGNKQGNWNNLGDGQDRNEGNDRGNGKDRGHHYGHDK